MADSNRKQILENLKTTLETISELQTVEIRDSSILDLDIKPLPGAFIYSGAEVKLLGAGNRSSIIGCENWEWSISVAVWARDTDMEDLLQTIHTAVYANRTLTSACIDCERMGVDMLMIDAEESLKAMIIDYKILYRHTAGLP